jgi:hypothetical protein
MNSQTASQPDAARSQLRAMVASVEGELARFSGPVTAEFGKSPPDGLRAAWDKLVAQLALGPEPEVRECPVCHHVGMRAATVCGYCWTTLEAPARLAGGAAPA